MRFLRLLLPTAMAAIASAAWGISLGDPRDAVLAEFGRPDTQTIRADAQEILTYPIGEIHLHDGFVCTIRLSKSPEVAPTASRREMALQLRIAELETRLAAARSRLAKAEGAIRSASAVSIRVPEPAEAAVMPTYSPAPLRWRTSTTDSTPTTCLESGRGL